MFESERLIAPVLAPGDRHIQDEGAASQRFGEAWCSGIRNIVRAVQAGVFSYAAATPLPEHVADSESEDMMNRLSSNSRSLASSGNGG